MKQERRQVRRQSETTSGGLSWSYSRVSPGVPGAKPAKKSPTSPWTEVKLDTAVTYYCILTHKVVLQTGRAEAS